MLTTENSIRTQEEASFIAPLVVHMGRLLDYCAEHDTIAKLSSLPEAVTKELEAMDKILTRRFKFTIDLGIDYATGMCTNIILPPTYNVLVGDVSNFEKDIQNYLGSKTKADKEVSGKNLTKKDTVIMGTLLKSVQAATKALDGDKIQVDYRKGTILGMPKDFVCSIRLNPFFILGRGANAREAVAGLLHEVGHTVTAYSVINRNVINSAILLETIQYEKGVRNNTAIDTLKIVSGKLGVKKKVKDDNVAEVMSAIVTKSSGVSLNKNNDFTATNTEKEHFADVFVSRFLLGAELTSFLSKLGPEYRPSSGIEMFYNQVMSNKIISIVLGILFSPLLPFVVLILGIKFYTSKRDIGKYLKWNRTYDDIIRRMLRIKQDATRQLRILKGKDKATENTKNRLVEVITSCDETMHIYKDNRESFSKWMDKISVSKDSKEIYMNKETIEQLMENDLHYYAEII